MDDKVIKKTGGISWFTASLFLIADMAGGGVVAMPVAMLDSGKSRTFLFANAYLI